MCCGAGCAPICMRSFGCHLLCCAPPQATVSRARAAPDGPHVSSNVQHMLAPRHLPCNPCWPHVALPCCPIAGCCCCSIDIGCAGLPKNCKWRTSNVTRCLFPQYFADEIETRLFPLQSLYDPLQVCKRPRPRCSFAFFLVCLLLPRECVVSLSFHVIASHLDANASRRGRYKRPLARALALFSPLAALPSPPHLPYACLPGADVAHRPQPPRRLAP